MIIAGNAFRYYAVSSGWLTYIAPHDDLWNHSLAQIDCFGWGAIVALHGPALLSKVKAPALLCYVSLCGVFLAEAICPFRALHSRLPNQGLSYGVMVLLCAAAVFGASGIKSGLLVKETMREIGKRTYGLYMYQGICFSLIWLAVSQQSYAFCLLPCLLLLAIAALLSYHFFEQPLLKFKDKFERIRSGPEA
jgi:peptidoglycan/LPS O-acetylase OafA/YrhL